MNELITQESLSYFKRKYDARVARKFGEIYSKYETNESSIDQTMMGYVYDNTPDCIIVHTNKGEEQHYLRMMDKTYACVIGSMLCTFTIGYSNDEYSMDVEQYNLEGNSDNSLIIPLAESSGSWSANVFFSDIREAMESGNDIYFSINGAIVSTTLREESNNSFTLMASMTDTQNSLLKVFSVFAASGIVSATCNQYTLTAYIPPQPSTYSISYNCIGATFVDGGGDLPATVEAGDSLNLTYSLNEETDYSISVAMGGVDITNSVVDRNNRTLYIPSVTDAVSIWFRYIRELSYSDNIGEEGDPDIDIMTNYLSGGYTDGDTLSITLTPADGQSQVSLTEATINGDDITSEITVNENPDGSISFNVTIEGGDLHIEAQVEEEPSYDYTLDTNMVNCWLSNVPEGFMEGGSYNTDVVQDDAGSSLISAEVTMGGVDITNDVWDESNGTISIASVTGDVYVHIEYTEPEPETVSVFNILNGVQSSEYEVGRSEATVGEDWHTDLTPTNGYQIQSVTVYMSGSDITSTAWYPPEQGQTQGTVDIDNVQGDIYIFAFAGDPSTSFSVTDNSFNGVTFDNLPMNLSIGQGGTYHYSIDPEYTYTGQSVYMNGDDISDLSTWYGDNYIFIPPAVGYVEITVETEELPDMNINWNLTNVTASPQPSTVMQGEDFGPIQLTSDNGNDIEVVVMMGDDDLTAEWYNSSTQTIESYGGVWEDVSIEAYEINDEPDEPQMWSIDYDGISGGYLVESGAEPAVVPDEVEDGDSFGPYYLMSNWAQYDVDHAYVYMNGVDITDSAYNSANDSIYIEHVTGDVSFDIQLDEIPEDEPDEPDEPEMATITFSNMENCHLEIDGEQIESGHEVEIGTSVDIAVVGDYNECEWFCNVLTMDGVDISEMFDGDGNPASIEISEVTGDIHIEIACSEYEEEPDEPEEPDYDYGLNLQLSYCDAPDAPEGFTAGENVDIELIPYEGYTLDFPSKLTITMGGVDITEQAYGYPGASGHAHIYINNVSGDVVAIVSAGEF